MGRRSGSDSWSALISEMQRCVSNAPCAVLRQKDEAEAEKKRAQVQASIIKSIRLKMVNGASGNSVEGGVGSCNSAWRARCNKVRRVGLWAWQLKSASRQAPTLTCCLLVCKRSQ